MSSSLLNHKSFKFSDGITWLTESWRIFARRPGFWLLVSLVVMIIQSVLAFIPVIGIILLMIISPSLQIGFSEIARIIHNSGDDKQSEPAMNAEQSKRKPLEFELLFTGFSQQFGPLALCGCLALLLTVILPMIALTLLFAMNIDFSIFTRAPEMDGLQLLQLWDSFVEWLPIIFATMAALLIWFFLCAAALIYAPLLIFYKKLSVSTALKLSLVANFRYFMPMLCSGLIIVIVSSIILSLTLGFGMIVLMPLLFIWITVSYDAIFCDKNEFFTDELSHELTEYGNDKNNTNINLMK